MAKKKVESIEYFQNIAKEDILADKDRDQMYAEIDDMVELKFDLPASITALPWIQNRKFISNAPRNATNAATRTFATLMPTIDIAPLTPDEKEWERVDKMETAIEWHFNQICDSRERSPLWRIVESAVKYCNVSMQTEYLPYARKGQSGKRLERVKRKGDFNFTVHHPSNVHGRFSNDMLERVTLACQRNLQEVIYEFGEDNPGIKKYLAYLDSDENERGVDRNTTVVNFYDYTDYDNRVIWFTDHSGTDMSSNAVGDDAYVVMNEPLNLKFLPWVIVDNQEPLLKGVYDTWCNLNIVKTIIFSKHVELAGHPAFAVRVNSKDVEIEIDSSNPTNIVKLLPGQDLVVIPPLVIDQQMSKTEADLSSEIYQSSAAAILGSVERLAGQGDSFSSMNAVLQAALAQLSLVRKTAEQALTEGFHQIFRWIDHSGEPLKAYRKSTKTTDREDYRMGSQIAIMPGMMPDDVTNDNEIWFDPDELYITVSLQSNSITDETGRITNEINKVDRLGFSRQSAYEKVGGMNFEQEQEQRAAEALFDSEIETQIETKRMQLRILEAQQMAQIQMQAQAAQMQMQQEQQMQQQQMNPEAANQQMNGQAAYAGAQGMDTRGGGVAPQAGAGGMGREQINQADANGVALA